MIRLATAHPAQTVTTKIIYVRVAAAGVIVLAVVAQLFTYERFGAVVGQYVGIGVPMADIMAAGTVTLEVAALPYLLAMQLSKAARMCSRIAGWLVGATWIAASFYALVYGVANVGLLGATVPISGGFYAVAVCLVFAVLILWSNREDPIRL